MKRSLEEESEFEVSDMHVSKSAKIHGVMTVISPMKESKKGKTMYFDGKLSDGRSNARFMCFDAKMHEILSNIQEKEPLMLSNCEVKESKYFSGPEVIVKKSSEIRSSPKKWKYLTVCL